MAAGEAGEAAVADADGLVEALAETAPVETRRPPRSSLWVPHMAHVPRS